MDERYLHRGPYDLVRIPEARSGKLRLVHELSPAGGEQPYSNFRTALIGGQTEGASHVTFEGPTCWHWLKEDDVGTWMSDLPIEVQQHRSSAQSAYGHVLIGGLGLGLMVAILTKEHDDVETITVVEHNPDVIKLVGPATEEMCDEYGMELNIVQADLMDYMRSARAEFDWAFFDVWQSDGQSTFFEWVMPLRQLAPRFGLADHDVHCWNEDVMRGQFRLGLATNQFMVMMNPKMREKFTTPARGVGAEWINWRIPFFKEIEERGIDLQSNEFGLAVNLYAANLGRPRWLPEFKEELTQVLS